MVWNIVAISLIVLAGIVLAHPRVLGAFRRFDARTRERIAAERQDRADALAHFRHTLKLAEEQVEEVSAVTVPDERIGTPVTRYLFEGETFMSEADAAQARAEKMHAIARGFYMDLPAALRARREEDKLKSN
jgi:hypothetical protein